MSDSLRSADRRTREHLGGPGLGFIVLFAVVVFIGTGTIKIYGISEVAVALILAGIALTIIAVGRARRRFGA